MVENYTKEVAVRVESNTLSMVEKSTIRVKPRVENDTARV